MSSTGSFIAPQQKQAVMTDEPDVHDYGRMDAFARSRQRVALLSASWRPMLAGAVASLAVSAAIWVVLPKVTYHDIEVPRISYAPVPKYPRS